MCPYYDDICIRVAIDGMDLPSVLSILQIQSYKEVPQLILGVDFFVKNLRIFDPRTFEAFNVKVQVWVMAQSEHFKLIVPRFYIASIVAFFIKENNVRTIEEFQAIVKDKHIPVFKILDTPQEFTLQLFESTMKELVSNHLKGIEEVVKKKEDIDFQFTAQYMTTVKKEKRKETKDGDYLITYTRHLEKRLRNLEAENQLLDAERMRLEQELNRLRGTYQIKCKNCGNVIVKPYPKDQLCPKCGTFIPELEE